MHRTTRTAQSGDATYAPRPAAAVTRPRVRWAAALVAVALAATTQATGAHAVATTADDVSVIVREAPGAGDRPEALVERLGGDVGAELDIIDGFVAELPADAVAALAADVDVLGVTPNATVAMHDHDRDYDRDGERDDEDDDDGIANHTVEVAQSIRADVAWRNGVTGRGVDVALVDTGVSAVPGLDTWNKLMAGPDLSFDGESDRAHADLYGHGTHLAGIIAGRDGRVEIDGGRIREVPKGAFVGVAPGARVVPVKVGDAEGVADVSQVIAAIDWVVQHRNAEGMNIRVLNLAFGTEGVQDYVLDPLTYAVEVAWRKGIVVVAAAGNSGHASGRLTNPAYDPFIIAVGATDHRGTPTTADDVIPEWSSRGDGVRNPDIVAPGKSIVSLIASNAKGALENPQSLVGTNRIKGSGTSQAAAVVSGAAALLLERFPNATPDQIKAGLRKYADKLPSADPRAQGAGAVDVLEPLYYGLPSTLASTQPFVRATGLGLLDPARGGVHVVAPDGVELRGEVTVTGATWSAANWAATTLSGATWSGSRWSGSRWSTGDWLGSRWSGSRWSGSRWSTSTWSGSRWSGSRWSTAGWLGVRWG